MRGSTWEAVLGETGSDAVPLVRGRLRRVGEEPVGLPVETSIIGTGAVGCAPGRESSRSNSSSQQLCSFMRCLSKRRPALLASRTCFCYEYSFRKLKKTRVKDPLTIHTKGP